MASSRGLSIREYARHRKEAGLRGGTPQSVLKALRAGRIHTNRFGKIDPAEADAAWERGTDTGRGDGGAAPAKLRTAPVTPSAASTPAPGSAPPYATSRAIREAYAAKLARIEYEAKAGSLVDAARVRAETFRRNRQTRDAILAVPGRLAAIFAAETDASVIEAKLAAELSAALEALSDG